jgi:putative ABC transport system substrate-binding protein
MEQGKWKRHAYRRLYALLRAGMPIEFPTKIELVTNLKTAKALGLDVPLHLQQWADDLIE